MTAGQVDAARRSCADGLARARAAGDLTNLAVCLSVAADLDLRAGHIPQAGQYLAEAVELALGKRLPVQPDRLPGYLRAPVRGVRPLG
jgi:hypothetical protein